jgi:hypothetical protein
LLGLLLIFSLDAVRLDAANLAHVPSQGQSAWRAFIIGACVSHHECVSVPFQTRGALAIPMLAMQAPGTALQAYFLGGPQKTGLTTWLPPACASVQMSVLLALCVYYSIREKRNSKLAQERVKLLGSSGASDAASTSLGGSHSDLESPKPRADDVGSVNGDGGGPKH